MLKEIFPIFDVEVIKIAVSDFDTIDLAYAHLSEYYEQQNNQNPIEDMDDSDEEKKEEPEEEQKDERETLETVALFKEAK